MIVTKFLDAKMFLPIPRSSRYIHALLRSQRFDPTFPHAHRDSLKSWRSGRNVISVNLALLERVFVISGLNAENIQDEARMDMVMDHIEDIRVAYTKMIYTNYVCASE